MKTFKISELIKELEECKKELGDIPVIHQKDPEGNGFGTIQERSIGWDETKIGKTLFIMPFDEDIEEELW